MLSATVIAPIFEWTAPGITGTLLAFALCSRTFRNKMAWKEVYTPLGKLPLIRAAPRYLYALLSGITIAGFVVVGMELKEYGNCVKL